MYPGQAKPRRLMRQLLTFSLGMEPRLWSTHPTMLPFLCLSSTLRTGEERLSGKNHRIPWRRTAAASVPLLAELPGP